MSQISAPLEVVESLDEFRTETRAVRLSDETHSGVASTASSKFVQGVGEIGKRASKWAGDINIKDVSRVFTEPVEEKEKEKKTAGGVTGNGMFADADNMRKQMREELGKKEYDIADFYYETGIAQRIARNARWQSVALAVIFINSIWIGIEIQLNDEANLTDAPWYFQVGEYLFCAFFVFEWGCRFFALKHKLAGLRDRWFCFDALLVFMMIVETLILPHALKAPDTEELEDVDDEDAGGSDVGQIGMLRMLRLLRLTRMVRFMRSVPELVTLLKSMGLAAKPVASTLLLLLCLLYTFGIIFKSQMRTEEGTILHHKFGRVSSAMATLLLQGTLLDSISKTARPLKEESLIMTALFLVFVLLSSFTVLNLLIGMVCEVVNVVALTEKEKAMVSYVKGKLMHVLEEGDEDGNGTISRSEFDKLMEVPAAVQALRELGVDLPNLISLADHLFEEEDLEQSQPHHRDDDVLYEISAATELKAAATLDADEIEHVKLLHAESDDEEQIHDDARETNTEESEGKCLTFGDFIETVIRLRPDQHPSVVDCVDLRKLYQKGQKQITQHLEALEDMNAKLATEIQRNICHHPLFIVISNHPEMQARMRSSHSRSSSSSAQPKHETGGMRQPSWQRTSLPESRREDDKSRLNVCDGPSRPVGFANHREIKEMSRTLDKASERGPSAWHSVAPHCCGGEADDDYSVGSRELDIAEELADDNRNLAARLRNPAFSGNIGRQQRAGQHLVGATVNSGASSSASSWSGAASPRYSSFDRRPSEGKLARILAATNTGSSVEFEGGLGSRVVGKSQAGDFSKEFPKEYPDETVLDEDVLGRVLGAADLYDEDDDWATGSTKGLFRTGREQTNTTGTGSATTGSPSADAEAESSDSRSLFSIADETVEFHHGAVTAMVQGPRALPSSTYSRHKSRFAASEDEGSSSTTLSRRLEAFFNNLGPFRLLGSVVPGGEPSPTTASEAAIVSEQTIVEVDRAIAELRPLPDDRMDSAFSSVVSDDPDLSEMIAPLPIPVPVTHVSGVTTMDVVVDDERAGSVEGLSGMFACSPLCCGPQESPAQLRPP